MQNDTLNTSSGIIRNRSVERVGIIFQHSVCPDFLDDIIREGINLSYEDFLDNLREQGKTEEEILRETDCYESDGDTYLFGDWKQDIDGKYIIDKEGKEGFAGTYSTGSGNLCVEWSKTTKLCHHTSPCYVMADGSGPCGDLDTAGDSVLAFALPADLLGNGE